jgi:hypothetical protein
VEVALQRGAQATPVPPGGQPAAPIDMYVPLGGDSSTAEALVEVQRPLNVWYRKQIAVRFANSIDGSIKPFGAYLLSGTQTLQVFEIPTPLQVSGPTSVSPGDTATFTARLTGNYRIELKGNPVSPGPYWTFYVDDTTAVPLPNPGARYQSEDIPACLGQMTCRFAPDRPGRVQVLGYVESRAVKYRSDVVRLDQGKLTLDCNGAKAPAPVTVVRGDSIKCTAATGPADLPIAEISWAFDDSASHHITGPPGARNWDGIMVVPGTMRLTARVSGQEQNLSMDVSIRARDWTGLIAFPEEPQPEWVNGPPLLYPPIVDGDTLRDGTLGQSTWPKPEPQSGYADGTGPNSGWYFFDKPPYFSPQGAHIYLNKALQPSDPFWRAQNGPPSDHVVTGRPECGPDFMRLAARKVPLHEHGHYSQARELAESPRGAALLESAVRWGEPITDEEQDSVVSAYLRADRALVAHWDSTDVLNVPCDFTRPRN